MTLAPNPIELPPSAIRLVQQSTLSKLSDLYGDLSLLTIGLPFKISPGFRFASCFEKIAQRCLETRDVVNCRNLTNSLGMAFYKISSLALSVLELLSVLKLSGLLMPQALPDLFWLKLLVIIPSIFMEYIKNMNKPDASFKRDVIIELARAAIGEWFYLLTCTRFSPCAGPLLLALKYLMPKTQHENIASLARAITEQKYSIINANRNFIFGTNTNPWRLEFFRIGGWRLMHF